MVQKAKILEKVYDEINHFIEDESLKEVFSENIDVYGTVDEYLELVV
jgi:hypothetical protein